MNPKATVGQDSRLIMSRPLVLICPYLICIFPRRSISSFTLLSADALQWRRVTTYVMLWHTPAGLVQKHHESLEVGDWK